MSNDADSSAKPILRTSYRERPATRASVRALEAQIVQLEARIATLLADIATLEAACQAMRRRLAGRHPASRA